jgi:hypothetical protein
VNRSPDFALDRTASPVSKKLARRQPDELPNQWVARRYVGLLGTPNGATQRLFWQAHAPPQLICDFHSMPDSHFLFCLAFLSSEQR